MNLHRFIIRRRDYYAWRVRRETYPEGWVVLVQAGWLLVKVMVSR